jgi:hypothetical protein
MKVESISVACDRQEPVDRRNLIVLQLRLLALRVDQELPIDLRSVINLLRVCCELFRGRDDE